MVFFFFFEDCIAGITFWQPNTGDLYLEAKWVDRVNGRNVHVLGDPHVFLKVLTSCTQKKRLQAIHTVKVKENLQQMNYFFCNSGSVSIYQ